MPVVLLRLLRPLLLSLWLWMRLLLLLLVLMTLPLVTAAVNGGLLRGALSGSLGVLTAVVGPLLLPSLTALHFFFSIFVVIIILLLSFIFFLFLLFVV